MIVEADNPHKWASGLLTIDVMMFACQSMWHLKDWILNDRDFGAKDRKALEGDIYASRCLLACADLANGSKHLCLNSPQIGVHISDRAGTHLDWVKGVFRHPSRVEDGGGVECGLDPPMEGTHRKSQRVEHLAGALGGGCSGVQPAQRGPNPVCA